MDDWDEGDDDDLLTSGEGWKDGVYPSSWDQYGWPAPEAPSEYHLYRRDADEDQTG